MNPWQRVRRMKFAAARPEGVPSNLGRGSSAVTHRFKGGGASA